MSDPFKDQTTEEHPSFVTVGFSRISGSKRFFGSSVTSSSWIELKIHKAKLHHDLGRDWIHGKLDSLIEVALSPAQFAELLTTINVGPGVPGTLNSFDGKGVEQPKEIKSETHRVKEHFAQVMKSRAAEMAVEAKEIQELLEKPVIGKADRKRLADLISKLTMQFSSSMPFYVDQFDEAAQRIAVQAKAEVDAFITHAVITTGLETLRAKVPELTDQSV